MRPAGSRLRAGRFRPIRAGCSGRPQDAKVPAMQRPTLRHGLLLLLLGALWGSSFLAIKVAVTGGLGPATVAAGRLLLGAAVLAVFAGAVRARLPREPRVWALVALVGASGTALPFFLIGWGEQSVDSAVAAILMATSPFWALALSHAATGDDRITAGKVAGVALGFAGVLVLVGPAALGGLGEHLAGQLAVIAAAGCYSLSGVLLRRLDPRLPTEAVALGALACGAALALAVSLAFEQPWQAAPGPPALAAVAFLGVVSTGIAFLVRFRLIVAVGYTFVSFTGYLVPVFGVLWGALLLGESLEPRAFAALGLILLGLAVSRLDARALRGAAARMGRRGAR